jgi:hypothetical protein
MIVVIEGTLADVCTAGAGMVISSFLIFREAFSSGKASD